MKARLKDQSGVAMLMAITTIAILAVLAGELVYQTEVYNRVVYNAVDNLRAKYLAKSAIKIARLQLHATNQAHSLLAKKDKNVAIPISSSDIDQIWKIPIVLPPPLEAATNLAEKQALQKFRNELSLPGTFSIQIVGQSGRLNLNQLVWLSAAQQKEQKKKKQSKNNQEEEEEEENPLDKMRELMFTTLDEIIQKQKEEEDGFSDKYNDLTGDILGKNILAWMDPKTVNDGEGIPKESYYADLEAPYGIKNAPIASISELNMIKGFDDEIVNLVSESFTTLITEGLNVNQINPKLLKALVPEITDEIIEALEKKKNEENEFTDIKKFWEFMAKQGIPESAKDELDQRGIVLVTKETAYRVFVVAESGNAKLNWTAQIGLPPPIIEQKEEKAPETNPETGKKPPFEGGEQIDPDKEEKKDKKEEESSSPYDNIAPPIVYLKTQ